VGSSQVVLGGCLVVWALPIVAVFCWCNYLADPMVLPIFDRMATCRHAELTSSLPAHTICWCCSSSYADSIMYVVDMANVNSLVL
jgi:hypothetical protein